MALMAIGDDEDRGQNHPFANKGCQKVKPFPNKASATNGFSSGKGPLPTDLNKKLFALANLEGHFHLSSADGSYQTFTALLPANCQFTFICCWHTYYAGKGGGGGGVYKTI
ncbi:hypothetical protein ACH5RR_041202 [Cinchona calisaya]|uniref:Uncharacterized protein n=1 Tax=Cinchona calisaya TaxID=153742 RepID=A0ABD2XW86_9GENT